MEVTNVLLVVVLIFLLLNFILVWKIYSRSPQGADMSRGHSKSEGRFVLQAADETSDESKAVGRGVIVTDKMTKQLKSDGETPGYLIER